MRPGCTGVAISTEFIKLDSMLKMADAVSSGGEAKVLIAEGLVSVNGVVERRRGRKLVSGDLVVLGAAEYLVEQAE